MKEEIEDLYGIAKKAYKQTIDLKIQLEFLMKKINDHYVDFLEEPAIMNKQTEETNETNNS